MRSLDDKARKAKGKKAAIGPDIDLDAYSLESPAHGELKNLQVLPAADREKMALAGLDISKGGAPVRIFRKMPSPYTLVPTRTAWKSSPSRRP